jgi:hypothetical protein
MYVRTYDRMCVCVCVCVYIYIYIHTYTYVCVCVCVYIYTHIHTRVCVCVCVCMFANSSRTDIPICTKVSMLMHCDKEEIEMPKLRKSILSSRPGKGGSGSSETKHDSRTARWPTFFCFGENITVTETTNLSWVRIPVKMGLGIILILSYDIQRQVSNGRPMISFRTVKIYENVNICNNSQQ